LVDKLASSEYALGIMESLVWMMDYKHGSMSFSSWLILVVIRVAARWGSFGIAGGDAGTAVHFGTISPTAASSAYYVVALREPVLWP
jgi:hypothetical protein